MRKVLLTVVSGFSLCATSLHAQFNTIAPIPVRYKVEALRMDMKNQEPTPESTIPIQDTSENALALATPFDVHKKQWIERYLSVAYPLPAIKVTSPYGYRKDPFTGKKRFHGGLDLRARGNKALAMMEGVVIKVGQDKTSGKYVTMRHGGYVVSYCHLSLVLVSTGMVVHPRDAVGITGSTGRSTGEHLHITCTLNGKSIDPSVVLDYIKSIRQECVEALAELPRLRM
ncbi:M23 family metallopeptidase [uncultured Bacteroides sp.]|uniref:M23 family metallopeptidase n=1 Tax=uncultured Bacteroides sp. TaxID=162156 RepID=UPI0026197C66|nr:M23 family metallopeptidase [uncultured Bacteroides sp.]